MVTYQNPHKIGDVGEGQAVAKFLEYGFGVAIPFSANVPYDLLVDWEGKIYKIQVKTAEKAKDGKMKFYISRTNPFRLTCEKYNQGELDYFFLYCMETKWCGLVSLNETKSLKEFIVHYDYPKNNNLNNYRMQENYSFDYKVMEIKTGVAVQGKILLPNKVKKTEFVDHIDGRVTREQLKDMIRKMPFTKIGSIYGVTDNAVRKWCKRMGLPDKMSWIKNITDEEWASI